MTFAESSGSWEGVKCSLLNKASEHHAGTCTTTGDGVTGAPVIELEYKHEIVMPYLKRLLWRHSGESGVVPRAYKSRP
jgi:hypothetical protein